MPGWEASVVVFVWLQGKLAGLTSGKIKVGVFFCLKSGLLREQTRIGRDLEM